MITHQSNKEKKMFTLQEALQAIENKPEFKVMQRDGFTVIDYVVQNQETFKGCSARESLILQNLRGTAFDEDGKIISLPLHKFHNLNECQGYMQEDIDLSEIESVMNKEDGSMIRPIPVADGKYRLGTRAGITDVSMQAETAMLKMQNYKGLDDFIKLMMQGNLTPVFEFVSAKNKIVLEYEQEDLVLLALRHNETGIYFARSFVEAASQAFNVSIVPVVKYGIGDVKHLENTEGVVVSLKNGFRFKVKSDWYVLRHRAKDVVRFSKDVVKLILEDKVDDVLPLLDEDTKQKLQDYRIELLNNIVHEQEDIYIHANSLVEFYVQDRKQFAEAVKDEKYSSFYFKAYDQKLDLKKEFLRLTGTNAKIQEVLKDFNITTWEDFK